MSIGKRIKDVREKKGMTMTELAKALGITPQGVSNWEAERFNPRPAMLTNVANVLQVDRTYLSNGTLSNLGEKPAEEDTNATTVGDVLAEAKVEIAAILKLPVEAITVNFTVTG